MNDKNRQFCGTDKAAELAGVSSGTMKRWLDRGMVQGYYVPGSSHRRIDVASLRKLLADNNNPLGLIDAYLAQDEAPGVPVADSVNEKEVSDAVQMP